MSIVQTLMTAEEFRTMTNVDGHELRTVESFRADAASTRPAVTETLPSETLLPGFTGPEARLFRGL